MLFFCKNENLQTLIIVFIFLINKDENDMSPTSSHEDQTLFDFKYCGHALNFEILHPKKYSAGSIILFILVILMVLFILSICWYRWKVLKLLLIYI